MSDPRALPSAVLSNPYRVVSNLEADTPRFEQAAAPTAPPENDRPDKDPGAEKKRRRRLKNRLVKLVDEFSELQRVLYAEDRRSVLLVFQAMDAAGKDSTIRKITAGVNPAGFQVSSFKQPSKNEIDHDFLWRTNKALPQRGRIGVFNRSYYEEVLVVRVHPEYLGGQRLPAGSYDPDDLGTLWRQRYESIADHERHLANNGTVILKFFLNVSQLEQKRRFLSRLEEPEKNWKFSQGDLEEAKHWPAYMAAYEDAVNATSTPWAPWFAIPADDKAFMRVAVAETVVATLRGLDLQYPTVSAKDRQHYASLERQLEREIAQKEVAQTSARRRAGRKS